MKRLALIALAVCLCVLPACAPSPADLAAQTADAAATEAAGWTATPDPTATPRPSATATTAPTATPQPTATFTASPRPSPAATRTPSDGRYVEPEGFFSYIPPIGWLVTEFGGLRYKIAFGTPIDDFAPNLIVTDEDNTSLLNDYVADNLEYLGRLVDKLVIVSQEPFTPTMRLPAIKVVIEDTQNDIAMRQTLYFFEGWSRKIIATYSRPQDAGEANDPLVDASMQSFRLIPREQATAVPTTSGVGLDCPEPCANTTVFTFAFPFEPSFPGYLIELRSEVFSADVMCMLAEGETTGQAVDLNDTEWIYGTCDTTSFTLDGVLREEVTITVILGGSPIINGVTHGPVSVTDYSTSRDCHSSSCVVAEYDFTDSVDDGPTG